MAKIMIVEDDKKFGEVMKRFLEDAGYIAHCVLTGKDALEYLRKENVDLIILDMALPDIMGVDLCVIIRSGFDCPIIYVSGASDTETIVKALESGGDDYLVKPVNYKQLLARIHAKLRRRGINKMKEERKKSGIVRFNQFTLDNNRHKVIFFNETIKEISLSPIEHGILLYMSENRGRLLPYSELYENVWDCASLGDVRTLMVHISNLRKKIDLGQTGIISTIRGAGYIFNDMVE